MTKPITPEEKKFRPLIPCKGYSYQTMDGTEFDCRYKYPVDCSDCIYVFGGTMDPRTGKTLAGTPLKDKFTQFALMLLQEHHRTHNPYVDDYPSARHAAKEHRENCEICKLIDKHPKFFGELLKKAGVK